ncbi:MAG: DUF4276 family protein [Phycisphaerae bacterium]|nr:DUF4276 family protein [Saprospiraceae bacterium]
MKIYIEGGGNSKEERARCREGFRKLFEKAGFSEGRMPRTVACGSRNDAFKDFQIGLKSRAQVSLMLVDSEDPVANITEDVDNNCVWQHLKTRDGWVRPESAANRQALLMATCMESWICADQATIFEHYGTTQVQRNALPSLPILETHDRHLVQDKLGHATRNSTKPYKKGNRSFDLLAKLNPDTLKRHLSQFRRLVAVLNEVMPK